MRWWVGIVFTVLALMVMSALQWRLNWVSALPHQTSVRAPIGVPVQPDALSVAAARQGGVADVAAITTALSPYLTSGAKGALGPHVDVLVTGLTGSEIFTHGTGPITPASPLKLVTATAALQVLGPQTRFTTSVRMAGSTITLVGGGDPLLATKPASATAYPPRASLTDLAAQTATYLKTQHQTSVQLAYDASLFAGPGLSPAWEPTYFTSGVIAPISALWADEGILPNGTASAHPDQSAADSFASLLKAQGITVTGPAQATAGPTSEVIAKVTSAPLVDQLSEILGDSDNAAAEVVARQVALAAHQPPTFDGAVAAITQIVSGLGIPTAGLEMHDGSGLSRSDRLEPTTLAAILRLAATTPRLSGLLTDLPIAGFDGTLSSRFAQTPAAALGLVRAKTGTLTGVNSMAGIVIDATGAPLVFVVIADQVADTQTLAARAVVDNIAAALTACRCSRP